MPACPIRLACFDLGGVLVRICRSWSEACHAANLTEKLQANGSIIDPTSQPEFLKLHHLHQTGRITLEEFAMHLSQMSDGSCTPDDITRVHSAWICGEYDGVGIVIDSLHEAGVETATLSNTSAEHWEVLLRFPTITRIRHRHASHLLGHAKPESAVFRAFEKRVGITGESIIFFDDLIENVKAARAIGWRAVHINHRGSTAQQMAAALEEQGVRLAQSNE